MKLKYAICFNLIRKTSGIILFKGMRDAGYETMGCGWIVYNEMPDCK